MLRRADPGDFAFIRSVAGSPAAAPFVTDEDEAALQAYADSADADLLIWESPGARGIALFCGLTDKAGVVELRRLALAATDGGQGRAFVGALTDHGFAAYGATRLWLDASGENARAQAIYEGLGYRPEGRLRRHWWRPALGRAVDLMLYGLLREEWAARRPPLAGPAPSA